MGNGSGRPQMARIKVAADGSLSVSFPGGSVTRVQKEESAHQILTGILGRLRLRAEPSEDRLAHERQVAKVAELERERAEIQARLDEAQEDLRKGRIERNGHRQKKASEW